MEIVSFKVSQYRSISGEITTEGLNGLTIVGKNNSGKTNLLQAVRVFFEGKFNNNIYDYHSDIPDGIKSGQTSFAVKFSFNEFELNDVSEHISEQEDDYDDDDLITVGTEGVIEGNESQVINEQIETSETSLSIRRRRLLSLRDRYLQLYRMIEDSRLPSPQSDVTVHLTITNKNNFYYSVFKGYKRKNEVTSSQYTSKERIFIEKLLSLFNCVYIPSSKSINDIYTSLLEPYIRKEVSAAIAPSIDLIHNKLAEISSEITQELERSGVTDCQLFIKSPKEIDYLFGNFSLRMKDSVENTLSSKGTGIQCLSLFSSFKSISKKEYDNGKNTIWMIEEPESFLHPSLSMACSKILESLQKNAYVVTTTHSLAFVSNDVNKIIELYKENGITKDKKHTKKFDAVTSIRDNLGVKFSDFFNISGPALFVEGITDKNYISQILKITSNDDEYKELWPYLRISQIDEFGGVSALGGFLKGCYKYLSNQTQVIAIFDGDDAGVRERKALQGYFGNMGIRFESNRDYVSIRSGYAIEGLFPDEFIRSLMREHPSWFVGQGLSVDAAGTVEPFSLQDLKKTNAMNYLLELCKHTPINEWVGRWKTAFDAIEEALSMKLSDMARLSAPSAESRVEEISST
ncbi:AAA family ATPase [Serratia ureilytica]|uniref:AAA family ATPase n=1 Tax=Serratia TaxID=613 RepID=UPI0018D76951|nr:AAA family ATPase [Serratia ureilytica]MBH3269564.1 AAA family ATPase [Serratia ureilytica]